MGQSRLTRILISLPRRLPILIKSALFCKMRFGSWGIRSVLSKHHRIIGYKNIFVGDRCFFGPNLRLEAITCYAGEQFYPQIEIGDNVCINQNFHCTCAESIKIGRGTSITANVGIFDIIHPYEDIEVNPREATINTKPIVIGEDCLIGMNSVIMPGTKLGNHCIVGANSTLSGAFPDYCVIVGSPAKIIKKFDFEKKEWIKVKKGKCL